MKRVFFSISVLLACFFAGCESCNPYKIAEKNINNAKQLRLEMTKAEVLTLMGEPLKDEPFNQPDIWFYYFDCNWLDGLITEEECFPLVFKEGKLIGWGNRFYINWQANRKNEIPTEDLPQKTVQGDK
ncbi:MAG: DUF3192 domain-containing protein [Lentisphaerae bacterium]|nr:DUF3192 domain-containing protein [Lentisphaerota bacterium]